MKLHVDSETLPLAPKLVTGILSQPCLLPNKETSRNDRRGFE